jgi:hypothetical protein
VFVSSLRNRQYMPTAAVDCSEVEVEVAVEVEDSALGRGEVRGPMASRLRSLLHLISTSYDFASRHHGYHPPSSACPLLQWVSNSTASSIQPALRSAIRTP